VPAGLPSVSVVVASHARRLRLRWLLNALEEQTLDEPWEVVVVHDYDAATAQRVLDRHPLAGAGRLRHVAIEPGTGSPSRQRNIGWREARAPLVAFTDDDCRPAERWLAELLDAWRATGAVVQGATRPEPHEAGLLAAPHVRTLHVEPVGPYAQTANMAYPRELLERLGGFDERAVAGEDVGLSLRARRAGATIVAAPGAVVFHAVESHTLPGILRQNWKWRYLAYLVKRHPEFRREMPLRVFWDEDHLRTCGLLAALALARRVPAAGLLGVPYVRHMTARRGPGGRARLTATVELPGQAVRQVAEVAGMLAGSVRHRTVVL
jgi:GT2 family glycosyltransferase